MLPAGPSGAAPSGPRLRVVGINDVYVLDNLPRLATLIALLAKTDPVDTTLVTLAGDFLAPSLLSSLDEGRGMVVMLNALGVTHVTFGNHEDDIDVAALRLRMRELSARWLGGNVEGFEPALPRWDLVEVRHGEQAVRVGLVGVVIADPGVYRRPPFGGVTLSAAGATARELAAHLRSELGASVVIPLTHTTIDEDRALARAQRDPPFPLILGGHDHQSYLEAVDGTWIAKSGHDAAQAIVAELAWSSDLQAPPHVAVRLEPLAGFAPDPELAALADRLLAPVRALGGAALYRIPRGGVLSSRGARSAQTSLGTLLASRIRDALQADVCLLNGGGLRGAHDYRGRFTYSDLETELPFDNEITLVAMSGAEIAATLGASRAHAPAEYGGFLQVDDRLVVAPSGELSAIAGAPFDAARRYRVAIMRNLLFGMDHIGPLVELARQDPARVPPECSGREVKLILVEAFGRLVADELGMDAVDTNHDGVLSVAEIAAAIGRLPE